jgi:hypothetical protein
MEYLAGATLDRLIPPNGLPLRQVLAFAIEIADALAKRMKRASSIAI